MKPLITAMILSCLMASGQALAAAAQADQPAPAQSQAARILPTGVCAAKQIQDAKGGTKSFLVVAPPSDLAQLLTAGFTEAPCGDVLQHLVDYRDHVCKTAAFGNDAVQSRFEQVLGVAPNKLCAFANSLLGVVSE